MALTEWKQPFFSGKMPACAVRGCWLSFCLVDESGDGNAYGGLAYKVFDSTGQQYAGRLDGNGFAKLDNPYRGPVVLIFDAPYEMSGDYYATLQTRGCYPLPITELQVRAEQTRFSRVDGERVERNPAGRETGKFYQVEVSDLVLHTAHLPPLAPRTHRPPRHALRMLAELGFGPPQPKLTGLVLFPDLHTVLEVRPLRALRPLLSIEDQFCALNLYQLALMATLSYCDFGQEPSTPPMDQVSFPIEPSVGNFFPNNCRAIRRLGSSIPTRWNTFIPCMKTCRTRNDSRCCLLILSCMSKIDRGKESPRPTQRSCIFLMTRRMALILRRLSAITTM